MQQSYNKKIVVWIFGLLLVLVALSSISFYQIAANWNDIESPIYSKSGNSIQVPLGLYILVRGKNGEGAFKLEHRISRYGLLNGVKYSYLYSSTNQFSTADPAMGVGTVYEKYDVVKVISNNEVEVQNAGGKYNIIVGNYLIEWSGSNHLYNKTYIDGSVPFENIETFAIAATNWPDISDIDFTDKKLTWLQVN